MRKLADMFLRQSTAMFQKCSVHVPSCSKNVSVCRQHRAEGNIAERAAWKPGASRSARGPRSQGRYSPMIMMFPGIVTL